MKKTKFRHFFSIRFLPLIAILIISIPLRSHAQNIKVDVVLHTDKLPIEEREYLNDLEQDLESIINSYNWIERGHEYVLPVRIEVIFEKYRRAATYRTYGAGVMVAIQSGFQFRDSRWDFRYSDDYRLHLGDPYDSFTGLVECFIWVCLAFELDKLSPLGGQPYYEKAKLISEKARFEIDYYRGWEDRREFITDLTLDKYREIRTASFHAAAGIFYAKKGNLESARSHLTRAAEMVMKLKPKMMNLKRDGNHVRFIDKVEFTTALATVKAFDILEKLALWDPENSDVYLGG